MRARFSKNSVFEDVTAEPRRVARLSLGGTQGRRSQALSVARKEFKGEGARCFGQDGLGEASPAAYARAIFEMPGTVGQEGPGKRSLTADACVRARYFPKTRLLFRKG